MSDNNYKALEPDPTEPAPAGSRGSGGAMTLRQKAILFMNISCVIRVITHALTKQSQIEFQVNPIDICFLRSLFLMIISIVELKISGNKVWGFGDLSARQKKLIVYRCLTGIY